MPGEFKQCGGAEGAYKVRGSLSDHEAWRHPALSPQLLLGLRQWLSGTAQGRCQLPPAPALLTRALWTSPAVIAGRVRWRDLRSGLGLRYDLPRLLPGALPVCTSASSAAWVQHQESLGSTPGVPGPQAAHM